MAKNARGSGCRAKRHAEIPLVQLTVRRRGQRRREAELKTLRLTGHVKMRQVFIPGGQPSITYVDRDHLGIERSLVKAIKLPSTIVSLTGPTKSGKTVLCTSVLARLMHGDELSAA